jgi:hypothetical protein
MVDGVEIRDLCKEWTWISGERVKCKAVDDEDGELSPSSVQLSRSLQDGTYVNCAQSKD